MRKIGPKAINIDGFGACTIRFLPLFAYFRIVYLYIPPGKLYYIDMRIGKGTGDKLRRVRK